LPGTLRVAERHNIRIPLRRLTPGLRTSHWSIVHACEHVAQELQAQAVPAPRCRAIQGSMSMRFSA
jgi:hypothetical protein